MIRDSLDMSRRYRRLSRRHHPPSTSAYAGGPAASALSARLAEAVAAQQVAVAELDQARRMHTREIHIHQLTERVDNALADTAEQRGRVEAAQERAAEATAARAAMTAELVGARQRLEDERAHTEIRLADQSAA